MFPLTLSSFGVPFLISPLYHFSSCILTSSLFSVPLSSSRSGFSGAQWHSEHAFLFSTAFFQPCSIHTTPLPKHRQVRSGPPSQSLTAPSQVFPQLPQTDPPHASLHIWPIHKLGTLFERMIIMFLPLSVHWPGRSIRPLPPSARWQCVQQP